MKNTLISYVVICLLFFSHSAWSASTKEEVMKLQEQVEEMQNDLAEIKKLLEEGARAPAAAQAAGFRPQTISVGTSPIKGQADAPVTIVEYSDYQCPYCAKVHREVMPIIAEEYIDSGKVRFVMREFPLPNIHKDATNASIAALCAGDQDKYWEMQDLLFENQKALGVDNLKSFAGTLGLDTAQFNDCLGSDEAQKRVRKDMASGAKLGSRGTPAFYMGLTDPSDTDKVELSVFIRGAQSADQFRASLDDLLESLE